jgi:hypothetical protein
MARDCGPPGSCRTGADNFANTFFETKTHGSRQGKMLFSRADARVCRVAQSRLRPRRAMTVRYLVPRLGVSACPFFMGEMGQ